MKKKILGYLIFFVILMFANWGGMYVCAVRNEWSTDDTFILAVIGAFLGTMFTIIEDQKKGS